MAQRPDRARVKASDQPTFGRGRVDPHQASTETEDDAVRDAFLKGVGPNAAGLASALSGADGATRVRAVTLLQQEHGNAYVQRVVGQWQGAAGQPAARADVQPTVLQRQPAPADAAAEAVARVIADPNVPGLSVFAVREATRHMDAHRWQAAIDVIVEDLADSGQVDRSLLTGGTMHYSGAVSAEADARPMGYRTDAATGARVARRTRVRIGRVTMGKGVPILYSIMMHEYQHVLQFQVGGPSVVPGQGTYSGLIHQQEVEAYAVQILNARQTGLANDARRLRERWRRLHDRWSRLGRPGQRPLNDLYRRAHAEIEAILGVPVPDFTPLAP